MHTAATVREDILQAYPELFGTRTIDGRTVGVEALIAQLTLDTREAFRDVLQARHAFQARVARREVRYDFLDPTVTIYDPDGHHATVSAIRQRMLDGFFGRATGAAWKIAPSEPIPDDVAIPGLEGTGPSIDLGMAMGALNSGAASWMWDWEDAGGDYRDQLYRAWRNLKQILAHEWDGRPFVHPTKQRGEVTQPPGHPSDRALRSLRVRSQG